MLEILARSDLTHESILVPVHPRQLSNVIERVLEAVGQLIRVEVAQSILDVTVHHQFGQSQYLSREMEGIPKSRLLPLLGRQRLGRLEVEIVIQMEIIELLPIDEQVEHVVPLTAHLQSGLDPIQFGALKEFGRFETLEQILLIALRLGLGVELIEYPRLEEFLIRDADLGGITLSAVHSLATPVSDEGNVDGTAGPAGAEVVRTGGVVEGNARPCTGGGQGGVVQYRVEVTGGDHLLVFFPQIVAILVGGPPSSSVPHVV
mmetsp:Transcript_44752/g.136556  ORF Transcript_44752/g.136556 Transcript_44752/m.136556 type:complete len:261 (+) Transcript_44752:1220-2002(+)